MHQCTPDIDGRKLDVAVDITLQRRTLIRILKRKNDSDYACTRREWYKSETTWLELAGTSAVEETLRPPFCLLIA